ncbi:MAG: RNA polymerase sporulation sigma factor SigH [Tyzzerella sp.]|nr:RNA polymerase sporulation sigma factor SigH [Tyzzerella sp.]
MKKYNTMTDEQLIRNLRAGDTAIADYIVDKYKFMVRKKAKAMYLLGGENDDLIQEGMIGLFKAVRDYDLNQEVSFYSFADLCVSRQMYTAIKLSQRQKHMPLNSYVSLYDAGNESTEEKQSPLIEQLQTAKDNNPEDLFLDKEYFLMMEQGLKKRLSDLESRVLHLHLMGEDYRSIAKLLDKSPKSIDNALQRIKGKVAELIEETSK